MIAILALAAALALMAAKAHRPQIPECTVAADLDGDRDLDIAVSSLQSTMSPIPNGSVTILENDGHGGFAPAGHFETGPWPWAVAAGDLNEDGRVDLVAASAKLSRLAQLLGAGGGSFRAGSTLEVFVGTMRVAILDLNGDAHLDIVTTRGDQQVAILRNEGKGVFSAPSGFKTVVEPCNIGAADFDGDGNLDLAVGSMANLPTGNLAVHRNVGGGSLSEPDIHDLGGKVWGVTAADLDGDGRPDLVATLDLFPQVPILWNDTKGGFLEKTSVSLTSTVDSSAAADFDTDGDLDLAVAGGGGYAGILENAGERRLEPAVRLEVGRSPRWVVAQDFDGDGAVDLAVLNQDSNDLTVLRNDGRGMFGAGRTTPLSSWWRPRFLQKP